MDLEALLATEWLQTNGLGGYASSTAAGINTRRYHGLLVAALQPPVRRYVLLSKVEETLIVAGVRYELSANLYPGVVHPAGYRYLVSFGAEPFPVWVYEAGGVRLEKRVFMVAGENAVVVEYVASGGECELEVKPLIAFRDFHSLTHENPALHDDVVVTRGDAVVQPYAGLPCLHFSHNGDVISTGGGWYRSFQYPAEAERGFPGSEDLFQPLALRFDLRETAVLVAGLVRHEIPVPRPAPVTVAEKFLVTRGDGLRSVIAGYHWFADWGRDALISLPGLTLVTGRFGLARGILRAFAGAVDEGMVPNRFPDAGERPEYNSMDASLWLFEAVRQYLVYTDDYEFVRQHLFEALKSVIDWHLRGTRYGIHCTDDGLLEGGDRGTQLTWMDAKAGDLVVTPRWGKPVEIQGLWYNALRVMEDLAGRFDDTAMQTAAHETASKAKAAFDGLFWNEAAGCFFDCVNAEGADGAVRPNQLLCFSLGYPIAETSRAASAMQVVKEQLLTPFGLRTLAPSDPQYRGTYTGSPPERDSAYHQGTVWPWLLGPFITAWVRAYPEQRGQARQWLSAFDGMALIPEIYDGDPPHKPRGCIAQAWSVAEIARAVAADRLR